MHPCGLMLCVLDVHAEAEHGFARVSRFESLTGLFLVGSKDIDVVHVDYNS